MLFRSSKARLRLLPGCAALLCGSWWHPVWRSVRCRTLCFVSGGRGSSIVHPVGKSLSRRIAVASGSAPTPHNSQAAAIEALDAMRQSLPREEPVTLARGQDSPQQADSRDTALGASARHPLVDVPDPVSPAQANFVRIYEKEEWGVEARSGLGSKEDTTREIRPIIEDFLRERGITSVVDAGCGHWPSGYQRFMQWQHVHYVGVDVVPFVVQENRRFFSDRSNLERYGLASAECYLGDVSSVLPAADLLIVKDVLMHLPNAAIQRFIANNLDRATSRHRFVLLVQNEVPVNFREMMDIEPGQLLPFNIADPPFGATGFKTIFRWRSDEPKSVQLWEAI